jgi:hypothetical protein
MPRKGMAAAAFQPATLTTFWLECCSEGGISAPVALPPTDRDMRALISVLTLVFTSAAHAQSACHQYEQELERARTLYYPSSRAAATEASSLTVLQDACKAELRQANPVCQWVLNQTVHVLENDKRISVAAACVKALEVERKERGRTDGLASSSTKQP